MVKENALDDFKQKVYDNRKMLFVLIILFLFAFSVRSNLTRYEGNYLFEPDAYYHARLTQEIVQQGYVNEIDPNVYYQLEEGMTHQPPSLYHYVGAAFYNIISLGQFDKELFALSAQILPIIFGALISIAMYFLGKEIFNNKKVGLIAGFLTATTPAFVYRTMAGAQGDNAFGFIWMVLGFLFLVRALKSGKLEKEDWINIVLAGLMFAGMVFSWRMNLLIPVVLLPSAAFMLLWICGTSKKEKILKSEPFYFIIKIAVPLIIYTLASYAYGENWILSAGAFGKNLIGSIEMGIILGIIGLIIFLAISFFFYYSNKETKKLATYLAILGLYIGLFAMLFMFAVEPDFFYPDRSGIGSMVGEESTGYQSFGGKYNLLIVLPLAGLFTLPIGLYFFKKKDIHLPIIFWFWTIITLFMAWYKLKFTFVFGLGVVTGAAITAYLVFELLKKFEIEKGIEAKATIGALFIIILLGIGGTELYITQFSPHANSNSYWIETMDWIKENTDEEANFFNWWGEGHQLAFVTERNFSIDNRNASGEANKAYAEFNITKDIERGYEIAKEEIGADYILLQPSNFNSGPTYEFYVNDKVDNSLAQKYYNGPIQRIGCSKDGNNLFCNGQLLQDGTFQENWHSNPDEFYQGTAPIYYYEMKDAIMILNQAMNETNLAKVYFNSPETQKYYEEVFYSKGLKLFRVK
jgi:asparagine N-glycosylation enzyme membrane subunit Stt3